MARIAAATKTTNPMTPYTKKLHQCLIEIGKAVEQREHEKTPNMNDLVALYNSFFEAVAADDMKAMSVTSAELISALVKWRVERV